MQKEDLKTRTFRFFSKKNEKVIVVRSTNAREFARWLDEQDWVVGYEVLVPLDKERVSMVRTSGIRQSYAKENWCTDFCIHNATGARSIREIIPKSSLEKRAEIEKLELSRRYWTSLGIADWKIVVI